MGKSCGQHQFLGLRGKCILGTVYCWYMAKGAFAIYVYIRRLVDGYQNVNNCKRELVNSQTNQNIKKKLRYKVGQNLFLG